MALWSRQKKVDVPAELQPYYAGDSPSDNRARLIWAARIVGALILIVLIVLFVRWAVHESHDNGSKKSPNSGTSQPPHKSTPKTGGSNNSTQQGAGNNNSSGSNSGSGTGSNQQSSAGSGGGQSAAGDGLTNTGPGQTVAVFFVTTVAGVTVYQYRLRRKAHSS